MTLQEIFEKLSKVEGGAEMVTILQSEFKKRNDEAAKSRVEKKKILDALELGETDDIESAIEDFKQLRKDNVKPGALAELQKKLEKLAKENAAEKEARTKERAKRLDSEKYNRALTALKNGNAINETELAKIIIQSIKANDDDSFAFLAGDKETSIEDGVKAWLDANKWAVRDTQNTGSGSSTKNTDGIVNPYKKETFNMTKQAELIRTNPDLAKKFEAEAAEPKK